jgi:putative DNA primase/helicase
MSAERIAMALGGRRCGDSWLCRCPGAVHARGDRNPSLLLRDGERALLIKCFAGCSPAELLGIFRERGLMQGRQEGKETVWQPKPYVPDHKPDPEALRIWQRAQAISSSPAERYLVGRGLRDPFPPSLRFHPDVDGYPAMVAAVLSPDRRVIAVQVTFLERDRKADVPHPRKTFGELGWGAVRLARATDELGLAEGTETALAAMQLTGVPTWACLGSQRMHRVAVPDGVRRLHVFGDNDAAGRQAVERTAHVHQGREVVTRFPPAGANDYADLLRERAAA